jgi:antitoxin (DNA-binding transcriptional repressor) of toxin-antitoxin stability system
VTPDQEARATAISAAASFCAPISGVADQQMPDGSIRRGIPNIEDVLFVADVFYGYVQGGREEALRIYGTSDKQQTPAVKDVELREQRPVQDVPLPEPELPATPSEPQPPVDPVASTGACEGVEGGSPVADIIPIEARGSATKEQSNARSYLNRVKEKRAESIYKRALVAKVEEHRQRLRDEAESSGVLHFTLRVDGKDQELVQHLTSLWSG